MKKYLYYMVMCLPVFVICSCSDEGDSIGGSTSGGREVKLLATGDYENLTNHRAVLTGYVDEDDLEGAEFGVVYSSSNAEPTQEDSLAFKDEKVSSDNTFKVTVIGLVPNTKYYYRVFRVVQGDEGENIYDFGETRSFTTKDDPIGKIEAVDLGLSVKWASCNIGADSPEKYGNYYAWGEVVTKDTMQYNWNLYKWGYVSNNGIVITKYISTDDIVTLDPDDDVANVKWGDGWRMPTPKEQNELCTKCRCVWTSNYNETNVAGMIVTGPNGNSIFLPVAGYYYDNVLGSLSPSYYVGHYPELIGQYGGYWSNTLDKTYSDEAQYLRFYKSESINDEVLYRCIGRSVRAVLPK